MLEWCFYQETWCENYKSGAIETCCDMRSSNNVGAFLEYPHFFVYRREME